MKREMKDEVDEEGNEGWGKCRRKWRMRKMRIKNDGDKEDDEDEGKLN